MVAVLAAGAGVVVFEVLAVEEVVLFVPVVFDAAGVVEVVAPPAVFAFFDFVVFVVVVPEAGVVVVGVV